MKSVAVVGASGAVGEVMVRLLRERDFPVGSIKFLASEPERGQIDRVRRARSSTSDPDGSSEDAFEGVDIVLSSTPASVSKHYLPIAAARAGAVVVDNSSAFRMDPEVPLVVPEVNPRDGRPAQGDHRQPQLLDDPDGRGPQAVARRLHGSGAWSSAPINPSRARARKGSASFRSQIRGPLRRRLRPRRPPSKFAHPIAFNCVPQIDDFLPNGLHQGGDEDGPRDPQDHGGRLHRGLPDLRPGALSSTAIQRVDPGSRPSDRSPPTEARQVWSHRPRPDRPRRPIRRMIYPLPASSLRASTTSSSGRIRQDLPRPPRPPLLVRRRPTSARAPPSTPSRSPRRLLKLDPVRRLNSPTLERSHGHDDQDPTRSRITCPGGIWPGPEEKTRAFVTFSGETSRRIEDLIRPVRLRAGWKLI